MRRFRCLAAVCAAAAAYAGQIPDHDRRNTEIPDTNTHFTMPEYKTVADWEARKARLKSRSSRPPG